MGGEERQVAGLNNLLLLQFENEIGKNFIVFLRIIITIVVLILIHHNFSIIIIFRRFAFIILILLLLRIGH